ncbi:MAG: right-handed parallel beta-helix repeat-containing protein [Armatimonadota bacterium]
MLHAREAAALTALFLISPPLAHAKTLRVPGEYQTAQAAINAAEAGDEVLLAAGVYDLPICVPRGRNEITIRGEKDGVTCYFGVIVQGRDIVVTDLRLEHGDCGVLVDQGASCTIRNVTCLHQVNGVRVEGGEALIEDLECLHSSAVGISAAGEGTKVTVKGATVRDADGPHSVLVKEGAAGESYDVTVSNSAGNGFCVKSGATMVLDGCVVEDSQRNGLVIQHAAVTVRDCQFRNCVVGVACDDANARVDVEGGSLGPGNYWGVRYSAGARGSIAGAKIFGNRGGVLVNGCDIPVTDNWIHDNSYVGVYITNLAGSYFHGSMSMDLAWAEEDLVGTATITGNRFENNHYGVECEDARLTNALTIDTDNIFDGNCNLRVRSTWYGAVRAMRDDSPIADAFVGIRSSGGLVTLNTASEVMEPPHLYNLWAWLTNSDGYAPRRVVTHDVRETWQKMPYCEVGANGERFDYNPWTVFARTKDGSMRGSCTYSWDGKPKSEGADVNGRYQVAYVYLNARPVARAGGDQSVPAAGPEGVDVILDASGSSDEDDDPLIFTWRKGDTILAGPSPEPATTVRLPRGVHLLTVAVDDGQKDPVEDSCTITVTPSRVHGSRIPSE